MCVAVGIRGQDWSHWYGNMQPKTSMSSFKILTPCWLRAGKYSSYFYQQPQWNLPPLENTYRGGNENRILFHYILPTYITSIPVVKKNILRNLKSAREFLYRPCRNKRVSHHSWSLVTSQRNVRVSIFCVKVLPVQRTNNL